MVWWTLIVVALLFWLIYEPLKFWIIDPWLIHRDLWSQGIPGRHIPIVGEILNVRRSIKNEDPLGHGMALANMFGPYYHVSFGPTARLDTYDPGLIDGVLKTNARSYHKAYLMRLILGVLLGDKNLLLAEDETHGQHRRLIAPVFQHQNMNSMVSLMVEVTDKLVNKWNTSLENGSSDDGSLHLNVHDEMSSLTLDIVTSCVFGTEIISDERMHQTIHRLIGESLEIMEKRLFNMTAILPIIKSLPLASKRRIDKNFKEGMELVRSIVDGRRRGLTKSSCKGALFLSALPMRSRS